MQPRLCYCFCGVSASPRRSAACGWAHAAPVRAGGRAGRRAARCPGLELTPATEKIIKNRTRCRQLSSSLRKLASRPRGGPPRRPVDPGGCHSGWRRMLLEVHAGGRRPWEGRGVWRDKARRLASVAGILGRGGSAEEKKGKREMRMREAWSCGWRKGMSN